VINELVPHSQRIINCLTEGECSLSGSYTGLFLLLQMVCCGGMLPTVILPLGIHDQVQMIHLRPATLADLDLLQHWDEQPLVLDSDPNDDWGWEVELSRNPDWREQLIAEIDDRPIGFIQIIDPAREDSHYWGKIAPNLRAIDIWIGEETNLGKGYGTQMMQLAIARCFADPTVTVILLDPLAINTRAQRFYERLGFQCIDRRWFGDDDCLVYRLNRANWLYKL
jgi:aminoglycoside 6'-N-acetyltransferase